MDIKKIPKEYRTMPGFSLDKLWGIRELYTTSSYHLKIDTNNNIDTTGFNDDVKKALDAYGLNGGKNFRISTNLGFNLLGSERYACLNDDCDEVIGVFDDNPCIVMKKRGKGRIYYCGTNLGESADMQIKEFAKFIDYIAYSAGIKKNFSVNKYGLHIDKISDNICIVNNNTDENVTFNINNGYEMLFSNGNIMENKCTINAGCADMLIRR